MTGSFGARGGTCGMLAWEGSRSSHGEKAGAASTGSSSSGTHGVSTRVGLPSPPVLSSWPWGPAPAPPGRHGWQRCAPGEQAPAPSEPAGRGGMPGRKAGVTSGEAVQKRQPSLCSKTPPTTACPHTGAATHLAVAPFLAGQAGVAWRQLDQLVKRAGTHHLAGRRQQVGRHARQRWRLAPRLPCLLVLLCCRPGRGRGLSCRGLGCRYRCCARPRGEQPGERWRRRRRRQGRARRHSRVGVAGGWH